MGRKLAFSVILPDDDGNPVTYGANTEPPAAVAKQITNPGAWLSGDGDDADTAAEPAPAKRTARKAAKKAAPAKAPAPADGDGGGAQSDTPPADDGGDEAWRAYASTVGVTVAEDADTAAVKAALDERGLLDS